MPYSPSPQSACRGRARRQLITDTHTLRCAGTGRWRLPRVCQTCVAPTAACPPSRCGRGGGLRHQASGQRAPARALPTHSPRRTRDSSHGMSAAAPLRRGAHAPRAIIPGSTTAGTCMPAPLSTKSTICAGRGALCVSNGSVVTITACARLQAARRGESSRCASRVPASRACDHSGCRLQWVHSNVRGRARAEQSTFRSSRLTLSSSSQSRRGVPVSTRAVPISAATMLRQRDSQLHRARVLVLVSYVRQCWHQ